jgi:ribulose-5-phosphate 4-epimerase/fuculose-1-phosphate aldolase
MEELGRSERDLAHTMRLYERGLVSRVGGNASVLLPCCMINGGNPHKLNPDNF